MHNRPPTSHLPSALEAPLDGFLRALSARNRSNATLTAYSADVRQLLTFVAESNVVVRALHDVERADVIDYLAWLADRHVSGVSRARKLAAVREFFRHLVAAGVIERSPAETISTPHKERNVRTFLRPEEYTRLLSLAGSNVRDFAILQTFLQTGVRVSELCAFRLEDIDLATQNIRVHGKGDVVREIELERKGALALRNWLALRPAATSDRLFLNKDGLPFSERGVRKLVNKYRRAAGITRRASCHSLRHTFATYKAERGVSPFQLQQWLGHASVATTQIYVHLGRQGARKLMEATSL